MISIQKKLNEPFFILLSLPATAMGFALSVQIAALSWLLSTQYKLNIDEVGFVWAAGPMAGIFGQLIIGLISDNVWFWNGRRRPFIIVGGVLAALMLLALPNIGLISQKLGFLGTLGVAVMIALTLDLSINIGFNPTRSIIADVTPEGKKRTQGYTWMQTISGMFGVLAYLISVVYGNYTLIYVGAGLVLLYSLLPVYFIEEPRYLHNNSPEVIDEQINPSSNLSELMKIYFAHSFTWIGVQTMFVYMFAYIKNILPVMSDDDIGKVISTAFLVLNVVGFILPAVVLEPLSRLLGRVKTHTFCIAMMCVGYALIYLFGNTALMLYIFIAIVGIGWAATVSLPFAIMTEHIDRKRMGLFMGIFNLSVVIPQLLVSFGIGTIIKNAPQKDIIFLISAIALGVSAALWLLVKENKPADKQQTELFSGSGH